MKDIPFNDLLSATDLDKNTSLVEAISRDFDNLQQMN
jgi:hypothetical protein